MDRNNATASPPSQLCAAKGSSPVLSSSPPTTNHHSSSSGLFNSVFPPITPLEARESASTVDIFGPSRKLENEHPAWNATHSTSEEGKHGYNPDKEHQVVGKDKISFYHSERTGPCSLSNSLYYGGQDICVQSPTTNSFTNKNDDEDDPASSHFASRGNWWQGSLYY